MVISHPGHSSCFKQLAPFVALVLTMAVRLSALLTFMVFTYRLFCFADGALWRLGSQVYSIWQTTSTQVNTQQVRCIDSRVMASNNLFCVGWMNEWFDLIWLPCNQKLAESQISPTDSSTKKDNEKKTKTKRWRCGVRLKSRGQSGG